MATRKPKPKPVREPDPLTPIFNQCVAALPPGPLRVYLESR